LGGLAFVGHSSSPSKDLWVAVAGPLTHLPQLALWLSVEVASFAAAGVGQPLVRWRVWPPSNNVWLALVTFAVRRKLVGGEKDRRRRKEEEERKKKKKTHSLSTPVTSTFVGKKSKKLFSSGPVQRRPLRLQPPAACLPLGRGSGPGGPAADVWGRGAERGEGHFGASSSSSFFRKKFRFFCCCSKKNSLDLSLFVSPS
jgi:hypothetical protein